MKINKSDLLTLAGFILFLLGMMSIFLSLIGVRFSFLSFIENWGGYIAFGVKLFMAIMGIVIVYIAQTSTPEK
ncbi:hypothetical protein [Membranihabitans marinus]|uniref:hypothetical protein n=1 Tax=Membranihabitans marinus TaxID=1227546 RepID=UPI001F24774B|nr:hypothetical protein [Membranihabitans marinus]